MDYNQRVNRTINQFLAFELLKPAKNLNYSTTLQNISG